MSPYLCPPPVCVRQLHSSGAVLTESSYGGLYPGHIQTSSIQKALLAVGSGFAALQNPYRHGESGTHMTASIPVCAYADFPCPTSKKVLEDM